ncbi:MAG: DEAD/DEAH box helicase [Polyangiaceae bacterium]|nr:DEAD/DEAH box helicase [Polyangiaceae bacterium]
MSSFHRLHPQLRHAIVHELGWRELRPVQELATEAILDGANVVVLAPTAGGKTEASVFPLLSQILTDETRPVAALYVCPIRALLNNQELRIQAYARMVGLDAFKWHGDVPAAAKRRFKQSPAHLVMITPESLEVLLMGSADDARRLFTELSAVVIDEIHAFADDDRGAHLVSILERLTKFCGRDLQRIGLSATVGNPDEIGSWLRGSSERPYRRVDPPRGPAERDLAVELYENADAVAREAARLALGKKSLVFVESRGQAERVADAMGGQGVDVFVHHSAVSRADRELAERQFTEGQNTAIVCTSTMELGIDVGDLDLVLQVDAPSSVASLLQRMGRTGRRAGTRSNCTFLCQTPETLLEALALLELAERGWVEDVKPVSRAAHVLAHQTLALSLQQDGISAHRIREWVGAAFPFKALSESDLDQLIATMKERQILHEAEGLLSLGLEGERLYGRQHFFELYAVFSTPRLLRVVHGIQDIGTVQAAFLRLAFERGQDMCFRLAGRAWQVGDIDWARGICRVVPAPRGRVPTWLGSPSAGSGELSAEMKRLLRAEHQPRWVGPVGSRELALLRESYAGLVEEGEAPVEMVEDGATWHTFAGGAINALLAKGMEENGAGKWVAGNLSLRRREPIAAAEVGAVVQRLREVDWQDLALRTARDVPNVSVSKFQPCLPDRLEAELLASRIFDVDGLKRWFERHRVPVSG